MVKKNKKDLIKIRIPILNDEYVVYIILGDQDKKIKWLKKHFEDEAIDSQDWQSHRARTHCKEGYMPVIDIQDKKYFYSEIAHEAVHAVDDIFTYIEDDNRGELFAHSVGAIIRAAEEYRKNERKHKKK
jgi:hypothetical protein